MKHDRRPSFAAAVATAIFAILFMIWLRFMTYDQTMVPLTYGLPLLLTLWHRDRRVHWGMAAIYAGMSTYKSLVLLPAKTGAVSYDFWAMQMVNIVTIGAVIDAVNLLRGRLEAERRALAQSNAELEATNEELTAREEEINRQNEELQEQSEELEQQAEELREQSEELQQQTEELQQQAEELQQQAEELQRQTEELRSTNEELTRKENILSALLDISGPYQDAQQAIERITALALPIVEADAGALLYQTQAGFEVRAPQGFRGPVENSLIPAERTLAALVLERRKPAFLEDLALRPDLEVPQSSIGSRMLAGASAPVQGPRAGMGAALEVYSHTPRTWSAQQMRLLEWMAAQAGRVLETIHLREERKAAEEALRRLNAQLEQRVAERTALAEERAARLQALAMELTQAERRERRRLAKVLHDHLQQTLAAAKLHAGFLLRRDSDENARNAVRSIDDLLLQAIETSRNLTVELSPAILHESGIAAGLA